MSLPHWSYVAMLAFCLVGTLPLVPAFRLRVLQQPRRLLLTIVAAGSPFVVWDLYATHVGHWSFDPAQTLPPRVAGLPLEEIAFFVVIPLVSVLTFEAVKVVRRRDRAGAEALDPDPRTARGTAQRTAGRTAQSTSRGTQRTARRGEAR